MPYIVTKPVPPEAFQGPVIAAMGPGLAVFIPLPDDTVTGLIADGWDGDDVVVAVRDVLNGYFPERRGGPPGQRQRSPRRRRSKSLV